MAYKLVPLSYEKPGNFKRVAGTTAVKALEGVENLASFLGSGLNSLGNIVGNLAGFPELPPIEKKNGGLPALSSLLQSGLGLEKEDLTPQSLPERYLYRAAEKALPAVAGGALFGGLEGILPALGLSSTGAIAGQTAEELGAGPLTQLAAEIGTELGVGKLASKFSKLPVWKEVKADALEKEPSLYRGKNVSINKHLQKPQENLIRNLDAELDPNLENYLRNLAIKIENKLGSGEADLLTLLDNKTSLHRMYNTAPPGAREHVSNLSKGIQNAIKDYTQHHPDFFKGLPPGRQMELFEHLNNTASEWLADKVKNMPLLRKGGKFTQIPIDVISDALGLILDVPERVFNMINIPAVRKYYSNTLKGIFKNDPALVAREGKKLNRVIEKYSDSLRKEKKATYQLVPIAK